MAPNKTTAIKTFEIVQDVTGFLEGTLDDWPAQMQDQVYKALERRAHKEQVPLKIVQSYCDCDYGEAADRSEDRYFVRIIASEIVVADSRYLNLPKDQIQQIIKDIMAGKTVN